MRASCGNQTATTTTTITALPTTEGKWEQIDFRSSLERGLASKDFLGFRRISTPTIYSDAFKDVTPTLTITGDSAVYELTATQSGLSATSMITEKPKKLASVEGPKNNILKSV